MTELEQVIALLKCMDARLARIERVVAPQQPQTLGDGDILDIPTFLRRRTVPIRFPIPDNVVPIGIPEGEGSL